MASCGWQFVTQTHLLLCSKDDHEFIENHKSRWSKCSDCSWSGFAIMSWFAFSMLATPCGGEIIKQSNSSLGVSSFVCAGYVIGFGPSLGRSDGGGLKQYSSTDIPLLLFRSDQSGGWRIDSTYPSVRLDIYPNIFLKYLTCD